MKNGLNLKKLQQVKNVQLLLTIFYSTKITNITDF